MGRRSVAFSAFPNPDPREIREACCVARSRFAKDLLDQALSHLTKLNKFPIKKFLVSVAPRGYHHRAPSRRGSNVRLRKPFPRNFEGEGFFVFEGRMLPVVP